MPSRIQVHALAHVTGEADASRGPSAAALLAGCRWRRAKRLRYLAAQRGDTPVAHDAAGRADDEPESAADHRPRPAWPARQLGAVHHLAGQRARRACRGAARRRAGRRRRRRRPGRQGRRPPRRPPSGRCRPARSPGRRARSSSRPARPPPAVAASVRSSCALARSTAALARANSACWSGPGLADQRGRVAEHPGRAARARYTPGAGEHGEAHRGDQRRDPGQAHLPCSPRQDRCDASTPQERPRRAAAPCTALRAQDAGSRGSAGPVRRNGFPCRESRARSTCRPSTTSGAYCCATMPSGRSCGYT